MERFELKIDLVKATSIDQFKTASGQRRLHMHYWQLDGSGQWLYMWVDRTTNPMDLEKLIKKGKIYLMEGAYDLPLGL